VGKKEEKRKKEAKRRRSAEEGGIPLYMYRIICGIDLELVRAE
jgi:hypothetical protein